MSRHSGWCEAERDPVLGACNCPASTTPKVRVDLSAVEAAVAEAGAAVDAFCAVNRPSYYNQGGIECIDAIETALGREGFIAFLRGQVLKYQWRLGHKDDPAQDAAKAHWYSDRLQKVLTHES